MKTLGADRGVGQINKQWTKQASRVDSAVTWNELIQLHHEISLVQYLMLPTPAPTTPGNSPPQRSRVPEVKVSDLNLSDNTYPEAPQNRGTAPFSVLSGLFDKLQNERKPEKRKRFLNAWFDVRSLAIRLIRKAFAYAMYL